MRKNFWQDAILVVSCTVLIVEFFVPRSAWNVKGEVATAKEVQYQEEMQNFKTPRYTTEYSYTDEEADLLVEDEDVTSTNEEEIIIDNSITYDIPSYNGFKSGEYYTTLTSTSSRQYSLQQYCYSDELGFRRYDDYYIVAIGTHFGVEVGDYVTLILENGTTIPCIIGDIKAPQDTDSQNIFSVNGCCTEFIISPYNLDYTLRITGDMSYAYDEWHSPVVQIVVEDKNNFFD